MRLNRSALIPVLLLGVLSSCGREATAHPAKKWGVGTSAARRDSTQGTRRSPRDVVTYSGTDTHGVPHYLTRGLSEDARRALRDAYGIASPSHLYISDSTPDGLLKYDPRPKPCSTCYVNSYRIGFLSIRKHGESWDQLERRVRTLHRTSFSPSSLVSSNSVSTMDPDVQAEVGQMLDAGRRAGFQLRVVSTYRSPQQEAILMAEGGGRTHTLTSLHSYGRAIDIRIGDGNLNNSSTRRNWIAFRRWVTRFRGDDFRILGPPDRSWDWPHVELPSDRIGFHSVDEAITAGRECLAQREARRCEFLPHLSLTH
ncbi:MAG: DUF882 domain-containing protein [Gemmatimonadota bacterium]|nr:DUF882 domain-containing protein [Gemmatimonadota bacterium]